MDKNGFYNFLVNTYFGGRNVFKLNILFLLSSKNRDYSDLSEACECSMPLLSYHLNGNAKNIGLIELGLVDKVYDNPARKTTYKYVITNFGRDVLKEVNKK